MITFTLKSRDQNVETFSFTNKDTSKSKEGTIDRVSGEMTLDEGSLEWPAEDARLKSVMRKNDKMEVGQASGMAFY